MIAMGGEGQHIRQAKRVRFDMLNIEAAKSGKFSSTREKVSQEPLSIRPKEQHPLTWSRHPTCATPNMTQLAIGKDQDISLKRGDRIVATRRSSASQSRVQIYCSNVDSIVIKSTSCRLEIARQSKMGTLDRR